MLAFSLDTLAAMCAIAARYHSPDAGERRIAELAALILAFVCDELRYPSRASH
jgi:hypothetical protein